MGIRKRLQERRQRYDGAVLALLASRPDGWFVADMWRQGSLPSGAIYSALSRLMEEGLAEAEWVPSPYGPDKRRRLYRATPAGLTAAAAK